MQPHEKYPILSDLVGLVLHQDSDINQEMDAAMPSLDEGVEKALLYSIAKLEKSKQDGLKMELEAFLNETAHAQDGFKRRYVGSWPTQKQFGEVIAELGKQMNRPQP